MNGANLRSVAAAMEPSPRPEPAPLHRKARAAAPALATYASLADVEAAGFARVGQCMYKQGHAIWELRRSEDGEGFHLVRKREEREVDLRRRASRTAASGAPSWMREGDWYFHEGETLADREAEYATAEQTPDGMANTNSYPKLIVEWTSVPPGEDEEGGSPSDFFLVQLVEEPDLDNEEDAMFTLYEGDDEAEAKAVADEVLADWKHGHDIEAAADEEDALDASLDALLLLDSEAYDALYERYDGFPVASYADPQVRADVDSAVAAATATYPTVSGDDAEDIIAFLAELNVTANTDSHGRIIVKSGDTQLPHLLRLFFPSWASHTKYTGPDARQTSFFFERKADLAPNVLVDSHEIMHGREPEESSAYVEEVREEQEERSARLARGQKVLAVRQGQVAEAIITVIHPTERAVELMFGDQQTETLPIELIITDAVPDLGMDLDAPEPELPEPMIESDDGVELIEDGDVPLLAMQAGEEPPVFNEEGLKKEIEKHLVIDVRDVLDRLAEDDESGSFLDAVEKEIARSMMEISDLTSEAGVFGDPDLYAQAEDKNAVQISYAPPYRRGNDNFQFSVKLVIAHQTDDERKPLGYIHVKGIVYVEHDYEEDDYGDKRYSADVGARFDEVTITWNAQKLSQRLAVKYNEGTGYRDYVKVTEEFAPVAYDGFVIIPAGSVMTTFGWANLTGLRDYLGLSMDVIDGSHGNLLMGLAHGQWTRADGMPGDEERIYVTIAEFDEHFDLIDQQPPEHDEGSPQRGPSTPPQQSPAAPGPFNPDLTNPARPSSMIGEGDEEGTITGYEPTIVRER